MLLSLWAPLAAAATLRLDSPVPATVYPEDLVSLSWSSDPPGAVFSAITVRLRQHGSAVSTLGEDHSNARKFTWTVGAAPPLGDGFDIQVVALGTNGTCSAATNTFSIQMTPVSKYFLLLLLLLVPLAACLWCGRQRRASARAIPVAQVYTEGSPPALAPYSACPASAAAGPVIFSPQPRRASGGSVAGAAAAGLVGGVVIDELLHTGHSSGHTGGGGVFDTGGGGDSSGGFFS